MTADTHRSIFEPSIPVASNGCLRRRTAVVGARIGEGLLIQEVADARRGRRRLLGAWPLSDIDAFGSVHPPKRRASTSGTKQLFRAAITSHNNGRVAWSHAPASSGPQSVSLPRRMLLCCAISRLPRVF